MRTIRRHTLPCCHLALIVSALLAPLAHPATVAHWRFEEGVAGNSPVSSILDSSGNGLHGTPLGTLTYSGNTPNAILPQSGDPNTLAMNFNGTGTTRVFIADDPLFQLTESLTLEAYVNMAAMPSGGHNAEILFRGDSRLGLDPYLLHIRNGELQFSISASDNSMAVVSTAPPTLNQWYHIAGVLDGDSGLMSLFLNGILVDSMYTNVRPFAVLNPSLNAGLSIGGFPATDYFGPFSGLIDEVRISGEALSPDEFLSVPPVVPVPAAAGLAGLGLATVGMFRRRRGQNQGAGSN
jgi:hypothetical protein